MDFAKKQLLKYGWKEGDGLGKNNDGISSALKPKLKFDKFGMGHDPAKEFTNRWWENTYKNALENVEVTKSEGEITVKTKHHFDDLEKRHKKTNYNSFLKTATLTNKGHEIENPDKDETSKFQVKEIPIMSDEDLLKACGKRTAHKGARHGLNLSGKLARIKAQEEELLLLDKYKKHRTNDTSINTDEEPIKKKKKKKNTEVEDPNESLVKNEIEDLEENIPSVNTDQELIKRKKKKKRKVELEEVCEDSPVKDEGIVEQKLKKKKRKSDKCKM